MIPEPRDFYELLERIDARIAALNAMVGRVIDHLEDAAALAEQTESLKQANSALEAAVQSNQKETDK